MVQDLAGVRVQGRGVAGEVDRVGASACGSDLLEPAGEFRVLGEAYGVAVDLGEVAQARRGVEGSAPVAGIGIESDGGALSG
ncbi:hypothetical protein Sm713_08980 [Streptomyces sp. TS71-3]|nr:hypothetical protein Sm713_08980 [Streptomyces sp. TS71-3]